MTDIRRDTLRIVGGGRIIPGISTRRGSLSLLLPSLALFLLRLKRILPHFATLQLSLLTLPPQRKILQLRLVIPPIKRPRSLRFRFDTNTPIANPAFVLLSEFPSVPTVQIGRLPAERFQVLFLLLLFGV